MISKSMYKVLKHIPQFPNQTSLSEMNKKKICNICFLKSTLTDAMSHEYIRYSNRIHPNRNIDQDPFYLTEAGQAQIEEYKRNRSASTRANCAIIISILSLVVATIALVLKFQGVQ